MSARLLLAIGSCFLVTLAFGQNQNATVDPRLEALQQADSAPIDFWGKVVDENGRPVAGATATFTVSKMLSDWNEEKPKITVLSDANGLFSLTGKTGVGIVVYVTKDGFYSTSEKSAAALNYFLKLQHPQILFNRAGTMEPYPNAQQPTIFTLTSKGKPAANLVYKQIRIPIPKDGTPVNIDLALGRIVPAGQGDLQVESWVSDDGKDLTHPFPWKCRVTVIHGGLQPRSNDLTFSAPTSGYETTDEVDMPVSAARWNKSMLKQYFLQLNGNRYSRMRFWMVSGGNNFLNLDYFINLQPGDLDLESAKYTPFNGVEIH